MVGERSCLSLIVAGSSTNAALGGVSAGGAGTPELDVTHAVLDQPVGSAGGVTPSKNSRRSNLGSHCPSSRSFPSFASAATILASPTAEAAIRNRQRISRTRVCMNVRFGFVVTESAVSLANTSRLPGVTLLPQSAVKGQHFSDSPRRSKKRKKLYVRWNHHRLQARVGQQLNFRLASSLPPTGLYPPHRQKRDAMHTL